MAFAMGLCFGRGPLSGASLERAWLQPVFPGLSPSRCASGRQRGQHRTPCSDGPAPPMPW